MLTYYEYAALSKTPHALADGLMLVFQHPVKPKDGVNSPSLERVENSWFTVKGSRLESEVASR
jgi:hypothetical protein